MKKHRRSNISPTKKQIGGDHYKLQIQPVDFILKNNLNYIQGNIIKYIVRYNRKHSNKEKQIEDLEKAKHYIQLLIEHINKGA